MRTKEEKSRYKEDLVKEWLRIFQREYEMRRAYEMGPTGAFEAGMEEVAKAAWAAMKLRPQDGSFLVDCKIEVRELAKEHMKTYGD